jgi:hypothetical protein
MLPPPRRLCQIRISVLSGAHQRCGFNLCLMHTPCSCVATQRMYVIAAAAAGFSSGCSAGALQRHGFNLCLVHTPCSLKLCNMDQSIDGNKKSAGGQDSQSSRLMVLELMDHLHTED